MTTSYTAPPDNVLWRGAAGEFEPLARKWNETFRMYVPITPEFRILEIGCGSGRMALPFRGYFTTGHYVGVDISEEAISWAQRSLGDDHLRFQHIDVANEWYRPSAGAAVNESRLPFEPASFDFIFLASVFSHLRAADSAAYLKDIARLLVPGGVVISSWFLLDDFARTNIRRGLSQYTFEHPTGTATWDHFPSRLGKATAIEMIPALEAHHRPGFSVELLRGGWSHALGGVKPEFNRARHNQDVLIGRL